MGVKSVNLLIYELYLNVNLFGDLKNQVFKKIWRFFIFHDVMPVTFSVKSQKSVLLFKSFDILYSYDHIAYL